MLVSPCIYQVDKTLSRQAGSTGCLHDTKLLPPSREFAALSSDMQNYNTTALLCAWHMGYTVSQFLQVGKITTQTIKLTKYTEKCCFNNQHPLEAKGSVEHLGQYNALIM